MTKLEAALRRVLRSRTIHPGDKWLVFSAFPDALAMLAKALAANNVQAVQLKGNREVQPLPVMWLASSDRNRFHSACCRS